MAHWRVPAEKLSSTTEARLTAHLAILKFESFGIDGMTRERFDVTDETLPARWVDLHSSLFGGGKGIRTPDLLTARRFQRGFMNCIRARSPAVSED